MASPSGTALSSGTIAPGGRGSYGIQLGTGNSPAVNVTVVHNIIAESVNRSAIVLYSPKDTVANVVIANNVLMNNAMYPIYTCTDRRRRVVSFRHLVDIRATTSSPRTRGNRVFFTATKSCSTVPPQFAIAKNLTFPSSSSLRLRDLAKHDYYPTAGSPLLNAALPGLACP